MRDPGTDQPVASRTWHYESGFWRDTVTLLTVDHGWRLRGTVRSYRPNDLVDTAFEGMYRVDLDEEWRTLAVTVQIVRGQRSAELRMWRDDDGRWHDLEDSDLSDLDDVTDVDIFLTPATNTIPIRRLRLRPGESRIVHAALISPGPDDRLRAARSARRYDRRTATTYRYASVEPDGADGFRADLVVDGTGLVERYGPHWVPAD